MMGVKPAEAQIMVVEDDDLLRSLFLRILKKGGYITLGAPSGNEAIRILESLANLPTVIYSDVRMLGGDGIELLAALKTRQLLPRYFVFITGHSDFTKEQAKSLGAYDMLPKPIDLNKILDYTQELVNMPDVT